VMMALFSRLTILGPATAAFLLFGLLVCMACGSTFAIVPLIRPRAVGSVSGIVGAGGNFGAVLAAMLFKSENLSAANAFLLLGCIVVAASFCALALRLRESRVSMTEGGAVPALMSAD
jgi:NNP family nitrate/nitrite transporter-like MFS transporter